MASFFQAGQMLATLRASITLKRKKLTLAYSDAAT